MSNSVQFDRSLDEWVDYVQTLHAREIELSLERVRAVYQRLYPNGFPAKVITVAGTNGKGSTAEILSSIYTQAGYRVGKFTSPHLIDFAERYLINGQQVSESALLAAFEKIERMRGDIGITFFEFGALLAIELFAQAGVDLAVMEVGLGGRLDAINILDADVAIITSISIDHTAWLGDTVEKIGFEKAGIARANKPCIVGIEHAPQSIIKHCRDIGAVLHQLGQSFSYDCKDLEQASDWHWQSGANSIASLPLPFGQAGVQLSNASVALCAISLLDKALSVTELDIRQGLRQAQLLARCQVLSRAPLVVLDVAHNQSSVERLADFLRNQRVQGRTIAICGMLQDKEVRQSLASLVDQIDQWNFATIDHPRGASADYMQDRLARALPTKLHDKSSELLDTVRCFDTIHDAFTVVKPQLQVDDCLLVFGSFFVAGDILSLVKDQ